MRKGQYKRSTIEKILKRVVFDAFDLKRKNLGFFVNGLICYGSFFQDQDISGSCPVLVRVGLSTPPGRPEVPDDEAAGRAVSVFRDYGKQRAVRFEDISSAADGVPALFGDVLLVGASIIMQGRFVEPFDGLNDLDPNDSKGALAIIDSGFAELLRKFREDGAAFWNPHEARHFDPPDPARALDFFDAAERMFDLILERCGIRDEGRKKQVINECREKLCMERKVPAWNLLKTGEEVLVPVEPGHYGLFRYKDVQFDEDSKILVSRDGRLYARGTVSALFNGCCSVLFEPDGRPPETAWIDRDLDKERGVILA